MPDMRARDRRDTPARERLVVAAGLLARSSSLGRAGDFVLPACAWRIDVDVISIRILTSVGNPSVGERARLTTWLCDQRRAGVPGDYR